MPAPDSCAFRYASLATLRTVPLPTPDRKSLASRIKLVKILAARKSYDEDPYVNYLIQGIEKGGAIKYLKEISFVGRSNVKDGELTIGVASMKASPGFLDKIGITHAGRATGLDESFAKTIYGIFKGAAVKAKADSNIKTIRLEADLVINKTLKKILTEFGFISKKAKLPLTEQEIAGRGQYLFLEIDKNNLVPMFDQ